MNTVAPSPLGLREEALADVDVTEPNTDRADEICSGEVLGSVSPGAVHHLPP
jgi:hypothetical protein